VIQFRKAFKLGPVRFTLTKSGVPRSVGFGLGAGETPTPGCCPPVTRGSVMLRCVQP
jgi:hypothetical protein